MTRVPGVPLSTVDLDTDRLRVVGEQLADMVYRWRQLLPAWASAGNLKCGLGIADGNENHSPDLDSNAFEVAVAGLHIASSSNMPGFGVNVVDPLTSHLQYYRTRLETRLQKLQGLDIFAGNRDVIPALRDFITAHLPKLGITSSAEQTRFFFTHYDLSPRNVLVSSASGSASASADHTKITGIIDFEFSGFFRELDEFVNDAVANKGDWPDAFYDAYLGRLEACGLNTPRKGIKAQHWREATSLARLEDSIAPWWLENVPPEHRDQHKDELRKTKEAVLEALRLLGAGVGV
ncbi:hypothetical protein BDW74DRAFT_148726 [Aspergillus multicolor]|uniref:uncharacterized protein n=1 Tax=Aspergillus multicolor TaxID=41759 RepID=UPI003CCC934D